MKILDFGLRDKFETSAPTSVGAELFFGGLTVLISGDLLTLSPQRSERGEGQAGGERMIFNFGFWIEEEMLTARSCGTRFRAQRMQRSERYSKCENVGKCESRNVVL